MKKSLKVAMAATVIGTPAMAAHVPGVMNYSAQNMENPLYMPTQNTFYSKLSNSVMLKIADDSRAHKLRNHDGKVEFPIIRIQEEIGYGITDRWAIHGSVQYTHDDDIDRTGLSAGRIGTTFRMLELDNGFDWDVYADWHLGGVGKMRGQFNIMSLQPAQGVFQYDNYSNGLWGFHVGTRIGQHWTDKLTTSAFVEVLRTFGSDNNLIRVRTMPAAMTQLGTLMKTSYSAISTDMSSLAMAIPYEVSVDMKSTTEVNAGANVFYQWSERWSSGLWFKYNHHADQGVEDIATELGAAASLEPMFLQALHDLNDGFDEYIIGLSVATQLTDTTQVALYGEYTLDTAHAMSQNGTDLKAEVGVRLNFMF